MIINENNEMFEKFRKQLTEDFGGAPENVDYGSEEPQNDWHSWLENFVENVNGMVGPETFQTKEELIDWLRTSADTLESMEPIGDHVNM
jgi:hypothetical protein